MNLDVSIILDKTSYTRVVEQYKMDCTVFLCLLLFGHSLVVLFVFFWVFFFLVWETFIVLAFGLCFVKELNVDGLDGGEHLERCSRGDEYDQNSFRLKLLKLIKNLLENRHL